MSDAEEVVGWGLTRAEKLADAPDFDAAQFGHSVGAFVPNEKLLNLLPQVGQTGTGKLLSASSQVYVAKDEKRR